jgi:hypothetical protein
MRLRRRSEAFEGPTGEPARAERPIAAREDGGGPAGVREREAPVRRGLRWRTRDAGAAAVGAAGAGVLMIARLVMAIATLIALLIALAIILRDLDANAHNTIVKGIHEGANFFAGSFTGLIAFNGHPKRAITVDWGIALLVYLIIGGLISRMIARVGRGGVLYERTRRRAATDY